MRTSGRRDAVALPIAVAVAIALAGAIGGGWVTRLAVVVVLCGIAGVALGVAAAGRRPRVRQRRRGG